MSHPSPVLVSQVMTSRLHTAGPGAGLRELWRILVDERCHHVPIVEQGRPVGMVSSRDLVRVARKHGARQLSEGPSGDETAAEIMSTELETIQIDDSVDVAIDRIGRGDIHALLVLDDDENLAGIVTNRDLLQYLLG